MQVEFIISLVECTSRVLMSYSYLIDLWSAGAGGGATAPGCGAQHELSVATGAARGNEINRAVLEGRGVWIASGVIGGVRKIQAAKPGGFDA